MSVSPRANEARRTLGRLAPDQGLGVVLEDVLLHVAGAEDEEADHKDGDDAAEDGGGERGVVVHEEPALDGEHERNEPEVAPHEHEAKAATWSETAYTSASCLTHRSWRMSQVEVM